MTIDVNVNLSRWPFRRLRGDEPGELAVMLRRQGISRAWAGSFDAVLHKDLSAVNARLTDDCRRYGEGLFVPIGTVNPKLPDWQEDLRRCDEVHGMKALRLHPGYHGYGLDDRDFIRLLESAAERSMVVQLALRMEDVRTHHPLMRVPTPSVDPLIQLLPGLAGLRLVLLNGLMDVQGQRLSRLAEAGEVSFEISSVEGSGGVRRLIERVGVERLLFGSHAPFFYPESASLKLYESELTESEESAIRTLNATRLVQQ